MKLGWLGLVLLLACPKHDGPSTSGSATPVSPGSGPAVGNPGSASGSPKVDNGAGSASPQVLALDDFDRWLAPIYKLGVPARYKALCAATPTLRANADALKKMPAPAGTNAEAWSAAADAVAGQVDSVGLCCQDVKDYDKLTGAAKDGADSLHDDCMKPLADAFAALDKLGPGASPPASMRTTR